MMICEETETVSVLRKAEAMIARYDMLPEGSAVIAAVSGGADSMCLLAVLAELRKKYGFRLMVCHYNHCLRGNESDGDAAFVAEYCRKMNIEYMEGRGDVAAESRETGRGIEETAREMRYRFFEECAVGCGGALVATAHNADDNAETVLMNLMRGTGAKGLGGIPPKRGNYIRPLLGVTRDEIEEYLALGGIEHREDSTNALDDVLRNRIRHHITPEIKALCPQWAENLGGTAELVRQDNDCLDALAAAFVKEHFVNDRIPASLVSGQPPAIASRAVRFMAGGVSLSREHTRSVLRLASSEDPSGSVDIPGMTVRREYDMLVFGGVKDRASFEPVSLKPGEWVTIPETGKRFLLEMTQNRAAINNSFTYYLFKKSEVCGNITIRPRTEGDTLHLPRRSGKSLKKLFIEKKIPAFCRETVPVVADEKAVLAVVGIGVDQRVLAKAEDEVYKLIWEDIDKDASGY